MFDLQSDHGMLDPVTQSAWWVSSKPFLPAAPTRIADLGCAVRSASVGEGSAEFANPDGVDVLLKSDELFRRPVSIRGPASRRPALRRSCASTCSAQA